MNILHIVYCPLRGILDLYQFSRAVTQTFLPEWRLPFRWLIVEIIKRKHSYLAAPRPRSTWLEVLGNSQYWCYQYIITITISICVCTVDRIFSIAWHIGFVSNFQGSHPNFPTLVATTFPQPNCRDH